MTHSHIESVQGLGHNSEPICSLVPRITSRLHAMASRANAGWKVANYLARFIPAVLRPHQLHVPRCLPKVHTRTLVDPAQLGAWESFFQYQGTCRAPFAYFTPQNSRMLFKLLRGLGINFKHLYLARHEVLSDPARLASLRANERFVVTAEIEGFTVLPKQRVLISCASAARKMGDDAVILGTRDIFLVNAVPEHALDELRQQMGTMRQGAVEEVPARIKDLPCVFQSRSLRFEMGQGLAFGLLSGDLNLAHMHRRIAHYFGHRRPFAQGLLTSNNVMARLVEGLGQAPRRFSIRYCRPLFLGQTVELRFAEGRFEIVDGKGSLLATGSFEL